MNINRVLLFVLVALTILISIIGTWAILANFKSIGNIAADDIDRDASAVELSADESVVQDSRSSAVISLNVVKPNT